ncbi:hypothetical protein EJ110_NYTH04281 [Nymphaea thermarum]|nr:hypothetical protein EJ110_NYTH04281 [Nymphaea thermarum]
MQRPIPATNKAAGGIMPAGARLGTQSIVIASSPSAAALVLKTHDDRTISYRSMTQVSRFDEYSPYSSVWSDCTDSWKQLRAMCRSQFFSSKMLSSNASLRQLKVEEMARRLRTSEGKEFQW